MATQKAKSGRGGARPGAGRKAGSRNRATIVQRMTITALAQEHGPQALETLSSIMHGSESDHARIAAACALLDRGFGRPFQMIAAAPVDHTPKIETEEQLRAEYARLGLPYRPLLDAPVPTLDDNDFYTQTAKGNDDGNPH